MNIKSNRRQNLLELLSQYVEQGWTNKQFAEHCKIATAHLHQMKSGNRQMGDEIARRIEQGLNLAEGYMDLDPSSSESALPVARELDQHEVAKNRVSITLRDDAMAPSFNAGDVIWYEPNTTLEPGQHGVIEHNGVKALRRYREQLINGEFEGFWVADNKDFPEIPKDKALLLGRAVQQIVNL